MNDYSLVTIILKGFLVMKKIENMTTIKGKLLLSLLSPLGLLLSLLLLL